MKTNTEIVTEFMDLGNPLKQVFVMQAIDHYSKFIRENERDILVEWKDSFINPQAWVLCAKLWEIHRKQSFAENEIKRREAKVDDSVPHPGWRPN